MAFKMYLHFKPTEINEPDIDRIFYDSINTHTLIDDNELLFCVINSIIYYTHLFRNYVIQTA